jgi:hypothetical protein
MGARNYDTYPLQDGREAAAVAEAREIWANRGAIERAAALAVIACVKPPVIL